MIDIRPGVKNAPVDDLVRMIGALMDSSDPTDIEFRDECVAELKLRKPAAETGSNGLQPTTGAMPSASPITETATAA